MYADLMFAYALARLGEAAEARQILERAPGRLPVRDAVHAWLLDAFGDRVRQALDRPTGADGSRPPTETAGRPGSAGPLQGRSAAGTLAHPGTRGNIDAGRRCNERTADELDRELAFLGDLDDRKELADRLNRLLAGTGPPGGELRALKAALELAPRLGEGFAEATLERGEKGLDRLSAPDRAVLLEKALALAGHFDLRACIPGLAAHFQRLLGDIEGVARAPNLDALLSQGFRSLRKLGLRDEVSASSWSVARLIPETPEVRAPLQRLLLRVAAGWFDFGRPDRAWPILDQPRRVLLRNELAPVEQTALACAYVNALGQAPPDRAAAGRGTVQALEGVHDPYTTHTHFSLARLDLVEATLLALVNEDFAAGPETRRLLDETSYLVRRQSTAMSARPWRTS